MDHLDIIVCSLMENAIGLKIVDDNVSRKNTMEASEVVLRGLLSLMFLSSADFF